MVNSSLYEAWMENEHATLFNFYDRFSTGKLIRLLDEFNEFKLLRTIAGSTRSRSLVDVGCASGGFYRFFRKVYPSLEYIGYDISEPAIKQAKNLYPDADFRLFDGRLTPLLELESDIVFSRDVVIHQTDPCGFLSDLYDMAGKYLILRMRTREVGATVFDPELSCQYNYGHWVPFIIFNTSELVDLIRSFQPQPIKISLMTHLEVLGGRNNRYLPKELYTDESGSGETALLIEKGTQGETYIPVVTTEMCPETHDRRERWVRWLKDLAHRFGP